MIGDFRYPAEKWYTEMARVISALQLKGRLSADEGSCLLGVLDLVCKERNTELIKVLEDYLRFPESEDTREIDEIIKATLTGMDFKSDEDVGRTTGIVRDLNLERERILSRGSEQGG